jgi:cellulose synthase operon protein C
MPPKSLPVRFTLLALVLVLGACGGESASSLVAKGRADLESKDPRSAVLRFKSALQLEPSVVETRILLGRALIDSGDAPGAVVELEKAAEQKANPSQVMPQLARALLQSGQFRKLIDTYPNVTLDDKAAQAEFQTMLAAAWSAAGNWKRADAALDAALAAVPGYSHALLQRVRQQVVLNDLDSALATVDKALLADPKLQEGWYLKAEVLAARRSDVEAVEAALKKALDIDKSYVLAHSALVISRIRAKDMDGAKKQLEVLRGIAPNGAETLFLDAQMAFFAQDYRKARELVQLLMRGASENTNLLQLAAAVEWQGGSLVIAERYLSDAVRLDPTLEQARINLAHIYVRLGQAGRAMKVVQPLIAPGLNKPGALSAAGEAALQLGDPAAAEGYYTRAAASAPDDYRTRTALAMAQLAQGNAQGAFAELESMVKQTKDSYADAALVSARLNRKELPQALAAADNLVKKQPDSALAHELRGRVLAAQGEFAASRAAFERSLALDTRRLAALSSLAALDLQENKSDQAIKRYEAFLKEDPQNHLAMLGLAELRKKAGAPAQEVNDLIASAVKLAPGETAPRLKLIDQLLEQRQIKAAMSTAQEAVAAFPDDVELLDAAGRALMADGNLQQALSTFRRITSIDPGLPVAHLRMADVYGAQGNRGAQIASLLRALEIDPNLAAARVNLVELLVEAKRSSEGLDMARELQRREPRSAAGYLLEGAIHRRMNDPVASIQAYRRGLQQVTSPGELQINLFASMLAVEKWKEAESLALGWIKKNPADGAIIYNLGEGYLKYKDYPKAEEFFARAHRLRPDFVQAANNLAFVMAKQGKPGAVARAREAVDLAPANPAVMDTLAFALASEKDFAKALEVQRKVVEMAPSEPLYRLNLAKIALAAGDKTNARTELERLVAMGERNAYFGEAQQLLKGL